MPLFIHPHLSIPDDELTFTFQRSSGPGGQNVNKVNSAARLSFDVLQSPTLKEAQKERLQHMLGHRITKDGVISVLCQQERSQWANKEIALQRLQQLLQQAFKRQAKRKPTKVSRRKLKARKVENQKQKAKKQRRGNVNLKRLDEHR